MCIVGARSRAQQLHSLVSSIGLNRPVANWIAAGIEQLEGRVEPVGNLTTAIPRGRRKDLDVGSCGDSKRIEIRLGGRMAYPRCRLSQELLRLTDGLVVRRIEA